ncbi:MAG: LysR family transcriptional regulator [Pseudomonas sp.]
MLNRIEMVRIFCAAAESRSFREAATRLGISPQGVTRAIQALESELGEPLFHRNTRQVNITAFGQRYAQEARMALEHFDALFRANRAEPEFTGRIGITAPQAIGRRYLIPFLQPLIAAHPALQFDLRLDDQMTDAVEAQIDIGIRVGMIRDRRYVARALAPVPLCVVASPELIEKTGIPGSLEALDQCPLSVLIDQKNGRPWPWLFADGQTFNPTRPTLICDDAETELEAMLAGITFGQVPAYLAEPYLKEGKLQTVLHADAPPPWDLFIYRPQQGPVSHRVRLVFDHLKEAFSDSARFPQDTM